MEANSVIERLVQDPLDVLQAVLPTVGEGVYKSVERIIAQGRLHFMHQFVCMDWEAVWRFGGTDEARVRQRVETFLAAAYLTVMAGDDPNVVEARTRTTTP